MSRAHRRRSRRKTKPSLSAEQLAIRLVMLLGVVALLSTAGVLIARSLNRSGSPAQVQFDLAVNPALNPAEATLLGTYLSLNADALTQPAGPGLESVSFEVVAGQDAGSVADNLLAAGLIRDARLFRTYLRYYGLDSQLVVGIHYISPGMTIPQVAQALTSSGNTDVEVRFTEGWRREEIAAHLDRQPGLPVSGPAFLALTGPGAPRPAGVSIVAEIPPDASLEGFLFPDTYRLAFDSTAEDLVRKMLENFETRITPQMRADALARGLSLYQTVTLASIVEREAAIPDERPLIASVYLNRLAAGMRLEADPTVQYAMGYQPDTGQWWNLNLTSDDYANVNSPYNTYLYPGLPPGPIANPGLSSIQAVIYPAETDYLFFRATCDGSGAHVFALTFEEHLANECP
jgi:UPF0755 protein